jgi:hypothetical protein
MSENTKEKANASPLPFQKHRTDMNTDIVLGQMIVYRHDGSFCTFTGNNAEDQAIAHQIQPLLDSLVKEQNQYHASPAFEHHCSVFYEAAGKTLDLIHPMLQSMALHLEPHFGECNLILDQVVYMEVFNVAMGDVLTNGVLLLFPGDRTLVLDEDSSTAGSFACRVNPTLAKPDMAWWFAQDQETHGERLSLGFISKGLLPYQIHYLKEKLIGARPVPNSFHQTADMMNLSNTLIREFLPPEQVDRREKSDLLQRSLSYFKDNERFHEDDFCQQVLEEVGGQDTFKTFRQSLGMEQDDAIEFDISKEAVQKQGRIFKSVLKLDKNFHVYIHGDKRLIERGKDESGRKYYKLYYDQEY